MNWTMLDEIYADKRLSATDKAVYTVMVMRADATHEYRFGVNYLTQVLGIRWGTAKQAIDRLCDQGRLAAIHPGTRFVSWRITALGGESVIPFAESSARRRNASAPAVAATPQDAPRMAMPPQFASDVLRYLLRLRRELDATLTSEMKAITREDRIRWQAEADHLDEVMETFTRWLARFGGGVPEDLARSLNDR